MRVVIIGVTGRIGKRVASLLVEQGVEVVGINRRPERAAVVLAGLPIHCVTGDTADPPTLAAHLDVADAVLLATAPTREEPEAYLRNNTAVVALCRRLGVPRLVAVSHYKALNAPDGRSMLEAEPPHPYFRSVEAVHADEATMFHAVDDLDWLLVAPPAELYPYGDVTGSYRIGSGTLLVTNPDSTSYKEVSKLSMEDFAHCLVGELLTPRHHRALVTAAY